LHVGSAVLSGTISYYKNLDDEIKVINMLRTFVFGGIDLLRVVLSDDKDAIDERKMNTLPPLQMHISSMEHMATAAPSAVLLNTNIMVKPGKENTMRKLLSKLHEKSTTDASLKNMILTFAINQDIQERNCFMMTQRFPDIKTMSAYQNLLPFKQFVTEAEDLLESPMGLYLVNERNGVMGNPVHTFGPMGEGGRDDSIYSSPVNLDGSMVNRV
jgi:quinol monooxygenase YgiN